MLWSEGKLSSKTIRKIIWCKFDTTNQIGSPCPGKPYIITNPQKESKKGGKKAVERGMMGELVWSQTSPL